MAKMWKLVLCISMLAGWGGAAAEIGHNMNNITRSMLREVTEVMEMVEVNYSEPIINVTYIASVEFDMRAMGPLYNSTHLVIDAIANKQAYPEGMVSVSDGHVNVEPLNKEWRTLLVFYAGPTAIIVIAVLVIAVLPLAGLFWCCCYWCRVGRRRRPFDRKYDACLKGLLAIILIALLTLFLFGVVCAFATDSQVETGSAEAATSLEMGMHDAKEFLNATQAHARWLLVVNYKELETKLNAMLYSIGVTASVKLGEFSRAVSVTTLNKMVQQLDDVQADLRTVHTLTATLRHKAEELNTGLRKVKNQLLQTLAKCDQPKCRALQDKYKIGQLDTEIQYSQMPDVSDLLNNVTMLLESDIKSEVAEGQKVFRDIQRGIQRSVDQNIPGVQEAIAATGRKLEGVANEITWLTGNASASLQRQDAADTLRRVHEQYGPYRRYIGLAAATALLLITCLLAWGLMCGVCGKRPDVYGASDCCNKGAGSKSLLCGMGVIFLVGGGVTLVLLVYFIVGVAAQRFICDPFTEPRGNRLFADLDTLVNFEKTLFNENTDPDFNMSAVLVRCHANYTFYEALHLRRLYDLESMQADVRRQVGARVAGLRPLLPPSDHSISILRAPAREKLRQLADTGLSDFDFDRILSALETNMTSLALDSLARQLNNTAHSLQQPLFAAEAASLLRASAALSALIQNVLRPMLQYSAQLNNTATKLRDGLRFNHSSLKEAISYLMHETTEAEVFLNTQGPDRLQSMTNDFAEVITEKLNQYLLRVVTAAREDVGRCGPLSNAYNATRDAACKKILMPTNGYWMSLSWCVLLFVPLMIVSQRLARLYLHVDPYPGPLVEAEYLYDAYADRDNVPLANGSKRSTLDIEGKIAEWRERSAPSAPPHEGAAPPEHAPPGTATRVLLAGTDVVCQLVHSPALIDDLKTRLDAKDEDNESGIHESDAYKVEKRSGRDGREGREPRGGGRGGRGEGEARGAGGPGGAAGGAGLAVAGGAARVDPSLAPPLDAYHARRYNDMAPKHWEEGPPRYHGPTEYERPPPYYYPGPKKAGESPLNVDGKQRIIPIARASEQQPSREPGTSWAEYLGDSPNATRLSPLKVTIKDENTTTEQPTTRDPAASWTEYLGASEVGLTPPKIENKQSVTPIATEQPTTTRKPGSSWAEYFAAASPSAPRLSPLKVTSKEPATPEQSATEGTGWSWTKYLNDRYYVC